MNYFTILFGLLQLVQVLLSQMCKSNFLRVIPGYKLKGTPQVTMIVETATTCAMRCVDEVGCRCCSVIKYEGEVNCMLYDLDHKDPQNIVKDERATIYAIMDDQDDNNKSKVMVEGTTAIRMTSSATLTTDVLLISPSLPVISPSLPVISPSTTSIMQGNLPPVACEKLYKDHPSSDGTYTVFSKKVFCDMTGVKTGCGGGGWTLVMRINGQSSIFKYSSRHWTTKLEYQPYYGQNLYDNEETQLSTYWTTRFTKICLGMSYNNQKGWAILEVASSSLFDLISNGVHHGTSLAVSKWKDLIKGSTASLQDHCRIQGINVQRGGTGARIGIIATKTCGNNNDYNSRLGFGTKGNSCGQDQTNYCGNDARCDAKPQALSIKTTGYILVK